MVQTKLSKTGPFRVEDFPEAHWVVGHGICEAYPNRRAADMRCGELRVALIRSVDASAVDLVCTALNASDAREVDINMYANPQNLRLFTHGQIMEALNDFANTYAPADFIPLCDLIMEKLEGE